MRQAKTFSLLIQPAPEISEYYPVSCRIVFYISCSHFWQQKSRTAAAVRHESQYTKGRSFCQQHTAEQETVLLTLFLYPLCMASLAVVAMGYQIPDKHGIMIASFRAGNPAHAADTVGDLFHLFIIQCPDQAVFRCWFFHCSDSFHSFCSADTTLAFLLS